MTTSSALTARSLIIAAAVFVVFAVIHLFDGNIFHPHRHTLAYSEPLVLPGLIGAPLGWLGASPVLTYNLLLLLGYVTTALAMYVVVATWTGDHLAALLAGTLLAFNTHLMTRLPHLQAIFACALPFSLWAFDRLLASGRTRHALWLGLGVLACALTSGHLAIFAVFALGAALIVRPDVWWRVRRRDVLLRLGGTAAVTLVVAVVLLWPYQVLNDQEAFRRPSDGLIEATPLTYLSTASRLHYNLWSYRIFRVSTEETLFPGVIALVLCAAGLGLRPSRTLMPSRMLLAIGLVGFVMSLGTATPVYGWAYATIPPLAGIRSAARFGFLVIVAVAGLAGLGLATLRLRWPARWMTVVSIAALAAANLEALHTPMPYVPYEGIPAIYQPIAADPEPGAVLELPIYNGRTVPLNASYMLAATSHWRPLVNGYSGHRPVDFDVTARRLMRFPAPRTIETLRALGVRYVVLHGDAYEDRGRAGQIVARVARRSSIELVAIDGGDRLYRLR